MSKSSCRTNFVHCWALCHRDYDNVFSEAWHGTYLRPNPVPSMVSRKVTNFSVAFLRCSFPSHCIILICFLILYWSWMYVFLDRQYLPCKFTVLWTRRPRFIIRDLACSLNLKVNYRSCSNTDWHSSQVLLETAQCSTTIYSKKRSIKIWTSPNLQLPRLKIIFDWS